LIFWLGTEWAVKHKAQVVNMSFAGPHDPDLSRELAEGSRRGVIFIAAVGNEGKAAKPSYPAAYEHVIPVTATDRADAIFKDASRCTRTCVAAPGVDILAAAPAGAYQYDSGTSMAAAQISGVVALLLDAKPDLESPRRLARPLAGRLRLTHSQTLRALQRPQMRNLLENRRFFGS
jgi:subtilisin family serine protease